MNLRMQLKQSVLQMLKHGGVFDRMLNSPWRSERLLILCYHGLSLDDEHVWRPSTFMTPALFESRLRALKDGGYNVLPLGEAVTRLLNRTLPPRSVVITFDDGLYDFYVHAVPLLRQYQFPATLYLTTYYCEPQLSIFPLMCSYLLWLGRGRTLPADLELSLCEPVDLQTPPGRAHVEAQITALAKSVAMTSQERDLLLRRLAGALAVDYDRLVSKRLFHLMTPEEVKKVFASGIDIQLHTHRHRTPKDQDAFVGEIRENRDRIVAYTGVEPKHFCYPSGVYRLPNLPWLADSDMLSATTCDHGLANAGSNPLLLPRFLDSQNVTAVEFETWLTGLGGYLKERVS